MTTDITELAQLRKELSNPAICSKDHLRTLALSLVEALEKAQQQIQTHERAELTWMNALELPDDATRNDILPAIHAEKYTLRAANKRIGELESRTVTVKLPEVRITVAESRRRNMTWRELGAYNEGADVAAERIGKELTAQGIKWEAE